MARLPTKRRLQRAARQIRSLHDADANRLQKMTASVAFKRRKKGRSNDAVSSGSSASVVRKKAQTSALRKAAPKKVVPTSSHGLPLTQINPTDFSSAPEDTRPAKLAKPAPRMGPKPKLKPAKPAFPARLSQVPLKREQKFRLGNGNLVAIGGLSDEHGVRYVWVREGHRFALTRYDDWHGGGGEASRKLREQGMVIVKGLGDLRDCVDKLKRFPRKPIVTKPGWSRHGFVLNDGRVIVPEGRPLPLLAFARMSGILGQAGTLEAWIERVAKPLGDHVMPTFYMMMAFAAPLLRLTNRADNIGFELSGEAGRGKSTLQMLIASTAGPVIGGKDETYWRGLNTTINALETVMLAYNDMPLILDEAGLIEGGGNADLRASNMRELAFRLSAGQIKHRFGETAGPRFALVYMLSTNQPIASLGKLANSAEGQAIADRLITTPLLPDRPYGIFDACPPGYASSGALADDLKQAASDNYGHALPAFLTYLVRRKERDPAALQNYIERQVQRFVASCGINVNDGSEKRVAEAFGLVVVAGLLAKKAGVLPSSYRCMRAARAVLRLHRRHGRPVVSFDDSLRAVMHNVDTIDLRQNAIKSLPEKQRSRCPAFLYTGRSGSRELVVPVEHARQVVPGLRGLSEEPEVKRRLLPAKGRKALERPVGKGGAQVPCYVFDVHDLED